MSDYEAARAWLWRARNAAAEIKELRETRDRAFDELTKIVQDVDGTHVQSSPDPHKFDGLAMLSERLQEQGNRLMMAKAEIEEVIDALDDERLRRVLRCRCVNCLTLEETACKVHYSYKHVKRLQARGIAKVAEILKKLGLS